MRGIDKSVRQKRERREKKSDIRKTEERDIREKKYKRRDIRQKYKRRDI